MENGSTEILRWDIPSRFRWLGVIDAAIQEIGQELGWDSEERDQISIAVIEAVSNAIEHGNRFDADKRVRVELRVGDERFLVVVSDSGPGFDQARLRMPSPDPSDPSFLSARGRGIFIMRDIMDEMRIRRDEEGRFVVELEKAIKSGRIAGT
jgi:serine/threonine-protein kinase RsbW